MITNVESLINRERKGRYQHNMPVTLPTSHLDFYLTSRHPDPGLGDAEPYNESEILPVVSPERPQQIIEYEKASSTDALATSIRRLKSERKRLRLEYAQDLKRYWASLLSTKTKMKVFYKSSIRMVQLPIKRARIFVGLQTVRKRVELKPRLAPQYRRTTVAIPGEGFSHLRRQTEFIGLKLVTPYVWREVEVPRYRYITLRPAGMYPKRIRTRTLVRVKDWTTIRQLYAVYKLDRSKQLSAKLKEVSDLLDDLAGQLRKRPPRHMASWTDHGFVRPYPVGQTPYESVTVTVPGRSSEHVSGIQYQDCFFAEFPTWDNPRVMKRQNGFALWSPGDKPWPHASPGGTITPGQIEWYGREHGLPQGGHTTVTALRRGQGDIRFVSGADHEKQAMLAFSTVQSLTKAKDYQFQWFRSLVELKDGKDTLRVLRRPQMKRGLDFLTWMSTTNRMSPVQLKEFQTTAKRLSSRFSRPLYVLAGVYLACKFAIEPTISDIHTVVENTADWIFEIRRALSSILTDPNGPLNTYHARARYGDNSRILKLGSYLDLKVEDRNIEISVPCVVRWPCALWTPLSFPQIERGPTDVNAYHATYEGPYDPDVGWGQMAPPVGLTTRIVADNGIHDIEHHFSGSILCRHWYDQVYLPSGMALIANGQVDPSGLSVSPSSLELENTIVQQVFHETPVVERVPVYATSWSAGVVFAEYRLDDLLELLSHTSGAMPGISSLLYRVYEGAAELLTRLDSVKVVWELTPFSFVYDWFTDSGTLATILANAARTNWTVYNQIPQPLNGLWECRRSELLAGTPLYQVTGCDCVEYSTMRSLTNCWETWWDSTPDNSVSGVAPLLSNRRYRLRLTCTDDKVHVMRTGLYRVRRGEQTGYDGLLSYLPRVSVSIQGGKILSLSALITSLLGGEGR